MQSSATLQQLAITASAEGDHQWNAVVRRDATLDGQFFYSVRTTGVYCRPSCPSRLPRRENVRFHRTCAEAEEAGFRPCKRCRPDGRPLAKQAVSNAGDMIRFILGECSLGSILMAASNQGICAIHLGDDPQELAIDLREQFPAARQVEDDPRLRQWVGKISSFIASPRPGLDLPLDIRGTAFQQSVWQVLRNIPLGSTMSYGEVAAKLGAPEAVRAVARACAANPAAVAIPCHRVVRQDGSPSGYRWGIERKRALLDQEARA